MKACIALIIICLIISLSILALPVKAQEPLNLTIMPNGSIEPITDFTWLQQNGSTYTFILDIFATITVQRAGITIDGAGHTLQGRINLVGHDEAFNAYGNILVKNLRISNFAEGIYTPSNNNSFIGNFFDNARLHIIGGSGNGNLVKHNIFNSTEIFVDYNNGGNDVITENNFIDSWIFVDLAKPPIVDRNYWSNYTAEYPNATELDNSGIWDTPNVYDKFIGGSHGNYSAIDYHPLVNPITDFELPNFTLPLPSAPSSSSPSQTPLPTQEFFPILTVVAISTLAVVAIGFGLLIYFKKRRTKSGGKP